MRINCEIPVEPNQKYEVDRLRPEDAAGVASLFFSVYGPDYPLETYYIPERIMEENRNGNIYSVVARTPKGDVVAHGALYRSSPHHRNLYEGGQYMVHKDYRGSFAAFRINEYLTGLLMEQVRPDGVFGESVCNHISTQKLSARAGARDMALEVDLMPASAYEKEQSASGRVACLLQFLPYGDRPHEVFIPAVYEEAVRFILSDSGFSRTVTLSTAPLPDRGESELTTAFFPHAGVARSNVFRVGAGFPAVLEQLEAQAQDMVVLQLFLNLQDPWVGRAVELLRERGYFLGGYAPRWFDSDGFLMQKVHTVPDFEHIALYSKKAAALKELVQSDWRRAIARHPGS